MVESVFARIKNNLRAGRFYERRGWISDGHRTFYSELGVADIRFRLSLSEGAVDREQPERGESGRPELAVTADGNRAKQIIRRQLVFLFADAVAQTGAERAPGGETAAI